MAGKRSGLGRGLDALFVDNATQDSERMTLRISEVEPNRDQPRRAFDETALNELADSIREHGVMQPILVRPLTAGGYQIVAGERRWRAAKLAGLTEIPAVVKELTELAAMELALVENLQREDLNAVEEALGYRKLMDSFSLTQEQVAAKVGKSRPAVANALRLLQLPEKVLQLLRDGKLSAGHARALAALSDPAVLLPLAYLCIMATTVALLFQNVGQVWSDPASASVILSLESVFGVLFSVIFYGDPVTGRLLAGFALIFVAVVCSETKFSFLRRPAVAEAQDVKP